MADGSGDLVMRATEAILSRQERYLEDDLFDCLGMDGDPIIVSYDDGHSEIHPRNAQGYYPARRRLVIKYPS